MSQSWTENAHAPLLSRRDLDTVIGTYNNATYNYNIPSSTSQTDCLKADPNDPRLSVLLAPSHAGLPPAVVQIASADPLRDEGLAYEKALRDAGVKTKLEL